MNILVLIIIGIIVLVCIGGFVSIKERVFRRKMYEKQMTTLLEKDDVDIDDEKFHTIKRILPDTYIDYIKYLKDNNLSYDDLSPDDYKNMNN